MSRVRDSLHSVQNGADLSALAPVWAEALRREGLTSPVHVALWLDEHRASPPQKHVGMLLRRMRGKARIVDLSAELGVAHSQVQGLLYSTAMRLIVPHLDDVAAWARARQTGVGDEAVAQLSGTYPEVVALALDGWPARDQPVGESQVVEAYSRWMGGATLAEVAVVLGMTPTRLRQSLADGSSTLPRRLYISDVRDLFGWNHSTVSRHRRAGLLPPADGQDGTRCWWWESTIDQWAADREMHPCPSCGARYLTMTGLRGHLTQQH